MVGHRMVFHILTAEGDLKDVYAIPTEYTPLWGNGDSRDDIYKTVAETRNRNARVLMYSVHA